MADHPLNLWDGSGNLLPDQEAEAQTSETEAETCHLWKVLMTLASGKLIRKRKARTSGTEAETYLKSTFAGPSETEAKPASMADHPY